MKITGIKYISPTFDNSGYAKASRGNILALYKKGIPITISPISFEESRPDLGEDGVILKSLVDKDIDYNIVIIHTTPEFWKNHMEKEKTNVGYTIWETTKLHPAWLKYINNSVDKVLVGCEWNKEVFKESGIEVPVGVVQHGIDMDSFDNIKPFNIRGLEDDCFVFYSIFQWTERKYPVALIKAYFHAFQNPEEKVALVLKTYRNNYTDKERQAIRKDIGIIRRIMPMRHQPKIFYIPNMLSEEEILGVHKRGDCYVSLDRGEGFGLSPFAAGACGNPLIVTGFGGSLEYAKPDNSYLVDYMLTPVFGMPWSPWYLGEQLWAEPDIVDGATKMRYVYENQNKAKKKGEAVKEYITSNFTWDHIGDKLIKELEDI